MVFYKNKTSLNCFFRNIIAKTLFIQIYVLIELCTSISVKTVVSLCKYKSFNLNATIEAGLR